MKGIDRRRILKVFLADDDKIIRMGLAKMIKSLSTEYEIVGQVANGEDALAFIMEHPIDVLITDIKMPVVDGVELIKALKKQEIAVKTIVLSGFDEYHYIRDSLKSGAIDYLLKPVDREELAEILQLLLEELQNEEKLRDVFPAHQLPSTPTEKADESICAIVKLSHEYIEKNYRGPICLSAVAEYVGLSDCYFSTLFKLETGKRFNDYLSELRIQKAKEILRTDAQAKIYEIGEMVGYEEIITFNRNFKKQTGQSPREYREQMFSCGD